MRSFRYVQYGRVMAANIPEKWYEDIPKSERENVLGHQLTAWQREADSENNLVEIRSRPQRRAVKRGQTFIRRRSSSLATK